MRTVQKGNCDGDCFDVRIIEQNKRVYFYSYLLFDSGVTVIPSKRPLNLKGISDISWFELPLKLKEAHYEALYPNNNLGDYEKQCFLYGKEQTDEEIAAERKKEEEREKFENEKAEQFPIYSFFAMDIYDEIGWYEKVAVIYDRRSIIEVLVDDKYVIKGKNFRITSIQLKSENISKKKEWGHRVTKLSKSAGTNFNFATIVGKIPDDDEAIEILKDIKKVINSEEFASYIEKSIYRWSRDSYRQRLESETNFYFLSERPNYYKQLNWSKKFFDEVEKILNKKK